MARPSVPRNYLPGNLTTQALQDLQELLEFGRANWPSRCDVLRDALFWNFYLIEQGISLGHRRADIETKANVKFIVVKPYVIAYDEARKVVLTILHGRRDFPQLFP